MGNGHCPFRGRAMRTPTGGAPSLGLRVVAGFHARRLGLCEIPTLLGRFVNRPYEICASPLGLCKNPTVLGRARRPAPTRLCITIGLCRFLRADDGIRPYKGRITVSFVQIFRSARAGVDFLRKRAPFCLLRRHFPCQGNNPPLRICVSTFGCSDFSLARAIRESPLQVVCHPIRSCSPLRVRFYFSPYSFTRAL